LVGIEIPWPADILQKVEPLIFLGAFGGVHAAFKLVSFFAATQAQPANRLGVLFWAGACSAAALGSYLCLDAWYGTLTGARALPMAKAEAVELASVWRKAHTLQEGAFYTLDFPDMTGKTLTLTWANPPVATESLGEIHITLQLEGKSTATLLHTLELNKDSWTELRIPVAEIPNDTKHCTLFWHAQEEAEWIRQTGLRPVQLTDRGMLMAEPQFNVAQDYGKTPNVVIVALEGLSAEHVGALGYARKNTPSLDQFAAESNVYTYAYTPAPEATAACMTMMTGLDPLRHGYLGEKKGPLSAEVQTLAEVLEEIGYATAAFSEGAGTDQQDLVYGSGFEKGFAYFNEEVPLSSGANAEGPVTPRSLAYAGADVTFNRAAKWIGEHKETKFMAFVRVRELSDIAPLARYGKGFIGGKSNPSGIDVYDTALNWLDHQVGLFLGQLQELGAYENTCVIITAPYGMDFDAAKNNPRALLSERSLRVPLFVKVPGEAGRQRSGIVQLQDVAPTVLNLTGAAFTHAITGDGLLKYSLQREPAISMAGDPLILTLRDNKWRFAWVSGLKPFTWEKAGEESVGYMWDMANYRLGKVQRDNVAENQLEVNDYIEVFRKFIKGAGSGGNAVVSGAQAQ